MSAPWRPLELLGRPHRGRLLDDLPHADARVPEVHVALRGVLPHRLAVGAADRAIDDRALLDVEAAIASGDREARHQPLDVPLKRPGQRLVEVVDIEDEAAIRSRVDAEVRQVRVTAQLGKQARPRHAREVGGHHVRRAAVERKRRHEHPSVAQRHKLGHARGRLLLEQLDRVAAVRRRLPCRVGAARNLAAGGATPRPSFLHRQVLDDRGGALRGRRHGETPQALVVRSPSVYATIRARRRTDSR